MPRKDDIPSDLNCERLILGACLKNPTTAANVADLLTDEDFSRNDHKLIWVALGAIRERGEIADRIVLAGEMSRRGTLAAAGGLSALVSLDEGLPDVPAVEGYCRVLKDKAALR